MTLSLQGLVSYKYKYILQCILVIKSAILIQKYFIEEDNHKRLTNL